MKLNILKVLLTILANILPIISPELRKMIEEVIVNLYQHAKQTNNPFDDIAIELLAGLLGIDLLEE